MGSRGRKLGIGDTVPGLRLKRLDGGDQALSDLTARGPVMVAFYKVTCPTCQFTLPFLERMAAQDVISFIGISQDGPDATREFREDFRITFPSLLDSAKDWYPASNAFGITHVPTMYLLESDGRISWSSQGFTKSDLEELGTRAGVNPFRDNEPVPAFKAG